MLVASETGSGKTFAYLLPIVQQLANRLQPLKRTDGLVGLVLVPTRELALQTFKALEHVMHGGRGALGGIVVGGESKDNEKRRLRKGTTPRRKRAGRPTCADAPPGKASITPAARTQASTCWWPRRAACSTT